MVVELNEDGNDGVPANIPADGSEFTAAQKEALGYAIAIPRAEKQKVEVLSQIWKAVLFQ